MYLNSKGSLFPGKAALWQAGKGGLVCLGAENVEIRLEGGRWTRVGRGRKRGCSLLCWGGWFQPDFIFQPALWEPIPTAINP